MNSGPGIAWNRMALVGAVGLIALIGNLRASGSEGAPDKTGVVPAQARAADAGGRTMRLSTAASSGTRAPAGQGVDDVQLVPAIYAWNPDVRFIYYRRISKWM